MASARSKGVRSVIKSPRIPGRELELGDEALAAFSFRLTTQLALLALLAADTHDAGGGANGIQIRHFVTHDKDVAGLGDEFGQELAMTGI